MDDAICSLLGLSFDFALHGVQLLRVGGLKILIPDKRKRLSGLCQALVCPVGIIAGQVNLGLSDTRDGSGTPRAIVVSAYLLRQPDGLVAF